MKKWNDYVAILLLFAVVSGCVKESNQACIDQPTTAAFVVNDVPFNSLQEILWLKAGTQHSLQFMQQLPNGNQHTVIVVFNGDTAGTYPLLGVNSTNRASYFAPGVNGTTFEDTIQPGTLVITNFDHDPYCLSGTYAFEVDTLQIYGELQSLRPD